MKRKIDPKSYRVLKTELQHLEQDGALPSGDAKRLLDSYEETSDSAKQSVNTWAILSIFGSLLIGAGLLSFVASNWEGISSSLKFTGLLLLLIIFYVSAFLLEKRYAKTSLGLFYLGGITYGATLFLIGQIFNLSHSTGDIFLFWGIGLVPLAYYLKDQLVTLITLAFFLFHTNLLFWVEPEIGLNLLLIVLLPILYLINEERLGKSTVIFGSIILVAASFVQDTLEIVGLSDWIVALVLFVLGALLVAFPVAHYKKASSWTGTVIYGTTGIILTFPDIWKVVLSAGSSKTIGFVCAALLVMLLTYFISKNNLPAIVVVCALIFRYYVDFSFSFMPKSLFFIIGGLILLGFGFLFERLRKKAGEAHV